MPNTAGYYAQRIGPAPRRQFWKQKGWKRGQNNFAEDNEIRRNEFYDGKNIELIGESTIRMGRRGHDLFTTISGATTFNGWGVYKDPADSDNFIIATFSGKTYKITTAGVVTEIDNTVTWNTTAKMRGVLLRGYYYFGNGVDYLSKTDGSTIDQWTAITAISNLSVAFTGSGSDTLFGYTVSAVTDTGETEAVTEETAFGPSALDNSNYMTLTWDRKTDSNVVGYNVYKSISGGTSTLLRFVDQQASGATMTYTDDGTDEQSLIYEAPDYNTTGGIKGNIFAKYANTLFVAGNLQQPDAVFYGGTGSQWESFSPSDNGGWVKPGRGDGDKVTAMIGFEDFLFIFKENSIWKFTFGSDGGPSLVAVIPQYGTSSPDCVVRMEKDVAFLGSDGRYRILGYEPTQLNVIRTTDFSNRWQPDLDALDKSDWTNFVGAFFEQKYIVGNGEKAYPYDRRYLGSLGEWTNYIFDRFLVWDRGTGQQLLFGADGANGKIYQLLVDNTWDDDGDNIDSFVRFKREDGGEDTLMKYWVHTKVKLKNPRGKMSFITYKDGSNLVDETSVDFQLAGGMGDYMFDEGMFDEGMTVDDVTDAIQILRKDLEFEATSIYHQINVTANSSNHFLVQTMNGVFEVEDVDYYGPQESAI